MSLGRYAQAAAVATLFALATAKCGDTPTVAPVAEPPASSTVVTVTVMDPPFVADAAGVPTVTVPVVVAVAAPPVPAPPAVVVSGPSGTAVPGRCTQYEPLLVDLAPAGGWSLDRMSVYMWRESRCTPGVRSRTRDSGLLQINDVNLGYLRSVLGEWVDRYTLLDPAQNVRAAAALCVYWRNAGHACYRPWGGR